MPAHESEDVTEPADAEGWNALGVGHIQHGDWGQARACFARAVEIDPGLVKALNNLAVSLHRLGRLDEAEACYRRLLAKAAENLSIQYNYAALLGVLGRHAEALARVDHLLVQAPDMVAGYLLAADLELAADRSVEALARLDRALQVAPDAVEALTRRARLYSQRERWFAALADCDRALGVEPTDPDALHLRARSLQGLDRSSEAMEAFALAEAASPAPARVITSRAILLAELGRREEAEAALNQALDLQPGLADAWYTKANLTRYAPDHPDLATMERLAERPAAPVHDQIHLNFALGKAYLDQGDGTRAFARLGDGNRLKRMGLGYDPGLDASLMDRIAAVYSADRLTGAGDRGQLSDRPVFVVGMPRSGTTLVEQILASHPEARGVGEPTYLADLADEVGLLTEVQDFTAAALGRRYLECIGQTARRVIDKTPSNFLHLGLVPLILPGARVIHCRRDPLDTCLSCYSLLFTRGHEYAYDQDELGRFYGQYRRLMAHWREVLPAGMMLDFDYEALIAEPEAQIRRLLDFCGLPWDEACLRFHETPRRVSSASLNQVRAPLYSSSVGRARAFRPWLGPLEAALAQAGVS